MRDDFTRIRFYKRIFAEKKTKAPQSLITSCLYSMQAHRNQDTSNQNMDGLSKLFVYDPTIPSSS
jgi:hypothetical protein